MSDPASHERLVEELARSLAPVRPLPGPGWRAVAWFSAVLALAILLLPLSDAASLHCASAFRIFDMPRSGQC